MFMLGYFILTHPVYRFVNIRVIQYLVLLYMCKYNCYKVINLIIHQPFTQLHHNIYICELIFMVQRGSDFVS